MATVRRVRRIIRRVDAWTVFKVAAIFWLVAAMALVLGLVMFWSVIDAAGIPQRITNFLIEITLLEEGSAPFADSESYLRLAVFGSLSLAVLATGLTTLSAIMYNLIADVVGGVELIVLEESLTAPVQPSYVVPAPVPEERTTPVDAPTQETTISGTRG